MPTISAKIIQDSITEHGKRITTYELEYPRFIHAEFLTHRLFSRNSASSRAIPIKTMNENIVNNPASPVHWGKNQAGMQANSELEFAEKILVQHEWSLAMRDAVRHSDQLAFLQAHKQIANRVTEPFQHMKVVMTTTEDANWEWLRDHKDAQPEIQRLAAAMKAAKTASNPMEIYSGEWHVPYITRTRIDDGSITYSTSTGMVVGLSDALAVSASCCAQVSYRKTDDSVEKARDIFKRLIESEPCHASPVEHQATPMKPWTFQLYKDDPKTPKDITNSPYKPDTWEMGITHCDRKHGLWSGNFKGWIQHRQLIENNAKWN